MKCIQNSGHVKDTASSFGCMDYISRATVLDTNIYTAGTCGGRKEFDKKLPDPKREFFCKVELIILNFVQTLSLQINQKIL